MVAPVPHEVGGNSGAMVLWVTGLLRGAGFFSAGFFVTTGLRETGFLWTVFLAGPILAGDFFAADFVGADCLPVFFAIVFFADFLAALFLTGCFGLAFFTVFLAAAFLVVFLGAAFFTTAFLGAVFFFAVDFVLVLEGFGFEGVSFFLLDCGLDFVKGLFAVFFEAAFLVLARWFLAADFGEAVFFLNLVDFAAAMFVPYDSRRSLW